VLIAPSQGSLLSMVYNQLCKTLLLSFHWCRLFNSLHGLPSAVSARQPQYMIGKIIFKRRGWFYS